MKSLGRVTKSVFRGTRATVIRSISQHYAPGDFNRVRFIEHEVPDMDYCFHVLPQRKLVYIEVPKAASSFVLRGLMRLEGRDPALARNPHQRQDSGFASPATLGMRRFADLLRQPDLFVFTVVRHPLTRLLSCYLDKVAGVTIGDGSPFSQAVTGYVRDFGGEIAKDRPLTFAEFVAFACRTGPLGLDAHWTPQAHLVPRQALPVHAVLRFETLGSELPRLLQRLGAAPEIVADIARPHAAASDGAARAYYTPALIDRVAETYAEDFRRFGYAPILPPAA